MAIAFKENGSRIYRSGTGIITDDEKNQADKLFNSIEKGMNAVERTLSSKGLLSERSRVVNNALYIWYEVGSKLNKIAVTYKILGTQDEVLYWQSIYDHVSPKLHSGTVPKNSMSRRKNHFYLCALMATYPWETVLEVGSWSIWRDIFDNRHVLEDDRVQQWVVRKVKHWVTNEKLGHKAIRKFLYKLSNELRYMETKVLSHKELRQKLEAIKFEIETS